MGSKKEIAIYHPFIDITDGGLIKTAALYWDEMQTIVPMSIINPYRTKASKEASREGFLKPRIVHPFDKAVEEASREFLNDITSNEHSLLNLVNLIKSGVAANKIGAVDRRFHIHEQKWSPIYLEKISIILQEALRHNRISGYLIVPNTIGKAYMSRLASMIAQHDNTAPLTNSPSFQGILIDRFVDYSGERKQNQAELAKLSLQTIAVKPDVPLVEILKFRDKHRKDLINYRTHIRKLVREISNGLDTSDKQSLFEEMVRDEFLPVKKEIEAKLSENTDWFMINNTVIMVAAIGTILLTGGQVWLAGLLQGTVSLGINVWGNIRNDRKCVKNHPLGYLYQAQKKFGAKK
jgi:hypothetical protein